MRGQIGYRPDIDGLRALAIIPVVAFHAGLPGFSGGFVGVDVFFVISGFLITGLLLKEQEQDGRITLADFYARRVRRLLPALTVVVLGTIAAGFIWLPPSGDQQRLAGSAIAAATFVSNVFFWRQQGSYFGPQADTLPLLHTWTLAVEEQFYLLWPLAMMLLGLAARRLQWSLRRGLAATLVVGAAASFGLYLYAVAHAPGAAFYLLPARAWELGLGALLALAPATALAKRPRLAAGLGAAGLIAVLVAVFAFNEESSGPALALPVMGALTILAAGAISQGNAISRLLGATPLRLIGKVSYGWYLWHWPLLAVARIQAIGVRDLPRDLAVAMAALALASVTYALIEQPIRRRLIAPFKTSRGAIRAGLAMMAVCVAAAVGLDFTARKASPPGSFPAAIEAARTTDFGPLQPCHHVVQSRFELPPVPACTLGSPAGKASILLWGDSVAQQLIQPLDVAGRDAGVSVIARTASACRPYRRQAPDRLMRRFKDTDCIRFNKTIAAELDPLKRDRGLTGVIIAGKWGQLSPSDARALAGLVSDIHDKGLKVILLAQAPNGPIVSPDCLGVRGKDGCVFNRTEADKERQSQLAAFATIARQTPDVVVLDPFGTLCDGTSCPAVVDGQIAYRDRSHLSRAGALMLSDDLERSLVWATSP